MSNLSRRKFVTGSMMSLVATMATPVSAQQPAVPVPLPVAENKPSNYFDCVESHFDRLIHYSLDRFGSTRSGMWMSSIDIQTNELLRLSKRASAIDQRYISGAYWYADQPMLVAADAVATRSACKCYADSVDEYLRSYFHFVGKNRSLREHWQTYWDASCDVICDLPDQKRANRSHTPAWEALWRCDRDLTQQLICAEVEESIGESANSHAGPVVALDSLIWLMNRSDKTNADDRRKIELLAESARKRQSSVGDFSLIRSSRQACRFASLCLRAAKQYEMSDLRDLGMEHAANLASVLASTPTMLLGDGKDPPCPPDADVLQLAQQSLELHGWLRSDNCGKLATKFAEQIASCEHSDSNVNPNAEQYGRLIYFLLSAAKVLKRPELAEAAKRWADESVATLFSAESGMFRSRTGVDRCDAADGIGYLMLALLAVDGDDPTLQSAFSF